MFHRYAAAVAEFRKRFSKNVRRPPQPKGKGTNEVYIIYKYVNRNDQLDPIIMNIKV